MSDLHKFLFDGLPVRGILVRLTDSWREVLQRRENAKDAFPAPVRALLGEMAAAGVLMQSNINFHGALVLQVHGDGPVKLAVAEVQPDFAFRVTATVTGPLPEQASLPAMVNLRGKGRCAITLDPKDLETHPLRVGLSTDVTVDTHSRDGQVLAKAPGGRAASQTNVYTADLTAADSAADAIVQANLAKQ